MKRIITTFFVYCIFISGIMAQTAVVEVTGVHSKLLAVKALASHVKDFAFIRVKDSVERFTLKPQKEYPLYLLGVNNRVVLFYPVIGDTVKIKVSNTKFIFSGAEEKTNNYLNAWSNKVFYSFPNLAVNNYMADVVCFDFPVVDRTVIADKSYASQVKELYQSCVKDIKTSKITNHFLVEQQKQRIDYIYWEMLVSAYGSLKFRHLDIPRSLLKAIDAIDFENPMFFAFKQPYQFVSPFLFVQEDLGKLKFTLSNCIAQKAKSLRTVEAQEYFILKELEFLTKQKQVIYLKEIVESCEPLMKTVKGKITFQQLKDKAIKLVENNKFDGVPAYPFAFEDQNGKKVKLEDFKGKFVYVDIWATWCGPCKQEIPNLQKLEKELEGENIVFISISVDRPADKEKWKAFLKNQKMEGITLMSPDAFNIPLVQKYGINGIPRFMLIAPDGTMISHHCWTPGDIRLKKYLKELLNKKY